MSGQAAHSPLDAYAVYVPTDTSMVERLFGIVLTCMLAAAITAGIALHNVKLREQVVESVEAIRTHFVIQEEVQKPVVKKAVPKPGSEKPVDLTKHPVLGQKEQDLAPKPAPSAEPVRRVYGLRRVYSVGIGAGGSMENAVIGKLGNTLKKDIDTITATSKDIRGTVVPVTTVETNPRYLKKPQPQYTPEMLANNIEGVINVKVLIDIDGKVKEATALNDLGFGSAEAARKACFDAQFEPAMRDGGPVAVWITIPIRFEILGK
jgi:TonB family protein